MRFWTAAKRQRGGGKCAAAGLLLLLWVGVFALTAVPGLHRLLHEDAQGPTHTCVITQLQQQQLLAGTLPVVVPTAPCLEVQMAWYAPFQFLHTCDYRLALGRAPPAVSPTIVIAG